ncbi:trypsin-like serine peptidase [Extensimonas sp. H3M7-6]|uniref:trypsin-like serine peptidase n=1 Tax=Extensimonas soli TaxID=3031322 RepID=UPI0023DCAC32|nr:trypsin-like peptidase domain-containing protein [Extensimonas sp. H3M7-6]MDF1482989.1 trypsin-like peptidase domain-containing protein [Extensimonas sp. H3M7-6]
MKLATSSSTRGAAQVCGRRWRAVGSIALAALVAACGGGGGSDVASGTDAACKAATVAPLRVDAYRPSIVQTKAASAAARPRMPAGAALRTVQLEALGAEEGGVADLPGVQTIGPARSLPQSASAQAMAALLTWQTLADGSQVAALRFQSAGAQGMRLGIVVEQLPAAAQLRFYPPDGAVLHSVTGGEILAAIARNQQAGDASTAARTYWSPDVGGDTVVLEIELPAGTDPAALRIAVPQLSHFRVAPQALAGAAAGAASSTAGSSGAAPLVPKAGTADFCEVDTACNADYANESNAVARMLFVDQGTSYLCTGTLLNDTASSGTPYFLSAQHCIASQTVASTLTTYWFYRAAACNGASLDARASSLKGGATLLATDGATDTALMRLNDAPPSGTVFAGWDAHTPVLGQAAALLHHPNGDWQKLSLGSLRQFSSCTLSADGSSFSCSGAASVSDNYLGVQWSSGATAPGSSGGALFTSQNGARYLVAHLTAGSASCSVSGGTDFFGRFDLAFAAGLKQWLAPASSACVSGAKAP